VPFVKGSPVQLLCKYVNEYKIEENDCIHIIASIETIYVDEKLLHDDNWMQLDRGNVVAINGLDGYAVPKIVDRFHYARPDKPSSSML
jgi:flavin reductase (DIM6/NTAB) family NADH-FMN oxidoreductase RutF